MEPDSAVHTTSLCSMTVERDPMKEEPEWDDTDVNEATNTDMYTKVKNEFIFEVALVPQPDVNFSTPSKCYLIFSWRKIV